MWVRGSTRMYYHIRTVIDTTTLFPCMPTGSPYLEISIAQYCQPPTLANSTEGYYGQWYISESNKDDLPGQPNPFPFPTQA